MNYTLTITDEQKRVIGLALDRLGHMHLGQTASERDIARKLEVLVKKISKQSTNDLTK